MENLQNLESLDLENLLNKIPANFKDKEHYNLCIEKCFHNFFIYYKNLYFPDDMIYSCVWKTIKECCIEMIKKLSNELSNEKF